MKDKTLALKVLRLKFDEVNATLDSIAEKKYASKEKLHYLSLLNNEALEWFDATKDEIGFPARNEVDAVTVSLFLDLIEEQLVFEKLKKALGNYFKYEFVHNDSDGSLAKLFEQHFRAEVSFESWQRRDSFKFESQLKGFFAGLVFIFALIFVPLLLRDLLFPSTANQNINVSDWLVIAIFLVLGLIGAVINTLRLKGILKKRGLGAPAPVVSKNNRLNWPV